MNTYTLLDLLNNTIIYSKDEKELEIKLNGIKVPRIQRDYAQGRKNEAVIRGRFLNAIFNHLISDDECLTLDFIYGSLKEFNLKTFFTPLDGQQRLTTLFLVNWYIACKELQKPELYNYLNQLSSFSYETRPTAKRFSEQLTKFVFVNEPISEIKNAHWFLDLYTKDPTIISMMNMIEAIDKIYQQTKKPLFKRLNSLQFYVLPLDGFNLSDELYIKMNARGLQLTDFENFKADLINWMKSDSNKDYINFNKKVIYHSYEVPYYLTIASKLDNEWSDVFWSNNEVSAYDNYYLCFITRFFLTHYISISSRNNKEIVDSTFFQSFSQLKGEKLDFKYEGFEIFEEVLDYSFVFRLEKVLDCYSLNKENINSNIYPLWDNTYKWKLYSLEIIPRQYILFYGIVQYLEHNDFQVDLFKNWVRILWNIIINPTIRSFEAAVSTIKVEIKSLAKYSGNIDENLLSKEFNLEFEKFIINKPFETPILYQEVEKAKIFKDNADFKKEIYDAESHPMFKGHIAFLLEHKELENFQKRKEAAFAICKTAEGNLGKPSSFHWLRAVLILNDDLKPFLSQNTLALNDTFEHWNQLLNNELKSGFSKLLNLGVATNDINLIDSLIDDYQFSLENLWLWNLVKENLIDNDVTYSLMDCSESKNIKYYENKIFLFNKTIWTEGNILLSTFRNHIIEKLLDTKKYSFQWGFGNIKEKYFRGSNPLVSFNFNGLPVSIVFDYEEIRIGIWKEDLVDENIKETKHSLLKSFKVEDENTYNLHSIDYSNLKTIEDAYLLANQIDQYISENYN